MSKGTIFWVIMIITAFFGWGWRSGWPGPYWAPASGLLVFVLFFLLGWQVFGFVVH